MDAKEVKEGESVSIKGNEINIVDARKIRDKDVFRLLVGFSITLVSGFVLSVILPVSYTHLTLPTKA